MKEIIILSAIKYEDKEISNYGDCMLINTGNELVIYDCGSEEHADRVIEYMRKNEYESAIVVLSHNDSDHFNGIRKLIEQKKVSIIVTTLLLKYVDDILELIDDKRRAREKVKEQILERYNNIAELSGENLRDIYDCDIIASGVKIIGPDKSYMLETVAKRLDGREGDGVDGETAVNATSIQVSIEFDSHKLLLCGDCSYPAIEDKVRDFDIIQLPHHGKSKQAEKIFEKKNDQIKTVYLVSDNTGGSNGGSDNLNEKGHIIHNTKDSDDIIVPDIVSSKKTVYTGRKLGY